MMTAIYQGVLALLFGLMIIACVLWRYYRAQAAKAEKALAESKRQAAVLKTQLNNQRERSKNEQQNRDLNREQLIDSLLKSGDIRD